MTDEPRDRIGGLLLAATGRGSFSAARSASADDLHLDVRGFGPVELPISEESARRLCAFGRAARYGKGEKTLVDPLVRNTWEIPTSKVKIDKRRWGKTLAPVLERLRADLGLPDGCTLTAELHSMLVYAPGQFFLQHQDSEKTDDMIGSLVVTLPSTFTGGQLEVEHRGETVSYRGSKKQLSFVAFYSDCRHQLKPVKSGHRVVLTYNLTLVGGAEIGGAPDARLVEELTRCLEEHFEAPSEPRRLVYLLDHEYTQRGLSWSRLKGDDVARVAALRMAAEMAACTSTLALVDVHETWSAFEPDRYRPCNPRYGGWDDDDDDDDDDEVVDDDGYELDELIESTVFVDSWLAPDGKTEQVKLYVGDDELCASTPSGDLVPRASEYEGYMGNWGNTLDRWYHRGAVVVWPNRLDFAVRAEISPSWALAALGASLRAGDLTIARDQAATVAPFWDQSVAVLATTTMFAKTMRTARLLGESDLAGLLLRPFELHHLAPSHAKPLSALEAEFGLEWTKDLVATWSARRSPPGSGSAADVLSFRQLCVRLVDQGRPGASFALVLLRDRWARLRSAIEAARRLDPPSRRSTSLAELGPPIAVVLQVATQFESGDLVAEVTGAFLEDDDLCELAIEVLRAVPPEDWTPTGLNPLVEHCRRNREQLLAVPLRQPDDWSVALPPGCVCSHCGALSGFLIDPAATVLVWPLAEA